MLLIKYVLIECQKNYKTTAILMKLLITDIKRVVYNKFNEPEKYED